jgi:murein DD-endopeptidase MepM/ murein hydrolase activator NlpD
MREKFVEYLKSVEVAPVVKIDLGAPRTAHLNLSDENSRMATLKVMDVDTLEHFIKSELTDVGADFGVGGYDEDRRWYLRSPLFSSSEEPRTIHLGVDIWVDAGTPVFSPLAGSVHSFHDNSSFGDYGPTLITKHNYPEGEFYFLYGHLSRDSISDLKPDQEIKAGEKIAELGTSEVNGGWPAHLHFQIIRRMGGMKGDYPGVARASERGWYLKNCPNPNLLLRTTVLDKKIKS